MSVKHCDASLTSNEPTPSGSAKAMLGTTAKEHAAHISGTNSTAQYTTPTTPHGKLGSRGKQS